MNPITNTKNQNLLNERELSLGYTGTVSSWHRQYKDSAWVFIGNLNYDLTEGDVICVFSQYGEVANINMVRDSRSGQSRGFAFLCYEDQRSTILATDNLNGITLAGRTIRVDHVDKYRVPKDGTLDVRANKGVKKSSSAQDSDMVTSFVKEHGCGPEAVKKLMKLQKRQAKLDEEKAKNKRTRRLNDTEQSHHRRPHASDYVSYSDPSQNRLFRNPSPAQFAPYRDQRNAGVKQEPLSPPRCRFSSHSISPPRRHSSHSTSPPRHQRSPHSRSARHGRR